MQALSARERRCIQSVQCCRRFYQNFNTSDAAYSIQYWLQIAKCIKARKAARKPRFCLPRSTSRRSNRRWLLPLDRALRAISPFQRIPCVPLVTILVRFHLRSFCTKHGIIFKWRSHFGGNGSAQMRIIKLISCTNKILTRGSDKLLPTFFMDGSQPWQ